MTARSLGERRKRLDSIFGTEILLSDTAWIRASTPDLMTVSQTHLCADWYCGTAGREGIMKWASPISSASLRWCSLSIISWPRTLGPSFVEEIDRWMSYLDRSADTLEVVEKGSDVARDEAVFPPSEALSLQ
jgi:hypothetical protein